MDLDQTLVYLKKTVVQAGKIAESFFESKAYTSKSKGGVDFVTQADIEIDTFLQKSIKKQFPGTSLLTEETAPDDYSHLKNADNLWIIDPLDGTVNFSRNNPHFAISVALVKHCISQLGLIYKPITKDLYWAQINKDGASLNDKKISVSRTEDLTKSVIACDWPWKLEKRMNIVKWLGKICTSVRQISMRGSGVADLASLAEGKIDAYIHSGLKPWDVAASTLLIEKAGGKITTPKGNKWNVFEPQILASNAKIHDTILQLINN